MRSGITYAALLTAASASAADYADGLVSRDYVAGYLADLVARSNLDVSSDIPDEYLVGRGYEDEYYTDNLMARDYEDQYLDADLSARDADILYARYAEAEPILGLNHIGKWIGQAAGAVSGGYKSRSNGKNGKYAKNKESYGGGGGGGFERGQGGYVGGAQGGGGGGFGEGDLLARSAEDDGLEELFYARDTDPEPEAEFEYYDEYLPYRRSIDDIEFQDELFYVREAEPEPILGLNHVGKWTGQAVGSVVGGYKSRSGGKSAKSGGKQGGYGGGGKLSPAGMPVQYERRDVEDDMLYGDELYIREAEAEAEAYAYAEAEPILGLNTVGKWVGQAVGSVAGGFRSKSGGKAGKEGKKDKKGKEGKQGKDNYGGADMGGGYGGGGQGNFM